MSLWYNINRKRLLCEIKKLRDDVSHDISLIAYNKKLGDEYAPDNCYYRENETSYRIRLSENKKVLKEKRFNLLELREHYKKRNKEKNT